MRTGPLNKRIKIQRRVETQNEFKETVISYVDWEERWASIEPLGGREYISSQQISADVTTKIVIRQLDGVTRKMRVVYERIAGSPTVIVMYEIDTVVSVKEGRREMWLLCREVDSEGFRVDGSG